MNDLQKCTSFLFLWRLINKNGLDGFVEDKLEVLAGPRAALDVLDRLDPIFQLLTTSSCDDAVALLLERLEDVGVLARVELRPDQDDRDLRRVVHDLGVPLGDDVVVRDGAGDREADQEDLRGRVAERAELVVLLLPGRVPERKLDRPRAGRERHDVVVKDGRDVILGELLDRVGDEQARLSDRAVADDNKLDGRWFFAHRGSISY